MLKEVTEYKARFHAMKLKIGFNVREDIELVRLVRETVGSDINLMIDANHGYDTREAIEVGRALAEFRVDWSKNLYCLSYRGPIKKCETSSQLQ